jgi:pilus assembly protein CpaE
MDETRPISVLVVDDSALMRRVVTDIIGVESDMEVAAAASGGYEALRLALDLQPDIVVMDIHMPDLDGIQATWLVANRAPHGAVIVASSEPRADVRERALAAGAQAFVPKPFGDGTYLLETIRSVHQRIASERLPVVGRAQQPPVTPRAGTRIAVFGTKGGVGRTTIAVGLALSLLRSRDTSVALFDAHFLLGDTSLHLNLPVDRSIIDVLPYNEELNSEILSLAMRRHASGLDVLAAPPRPEQAEVVQPAHVRAVLGALATLYEYAVVDTEPSYDERMLAVLDLADVHMVVLTPHLGAVRNARHFVDVARILGYPTDKVCFVLNQASNLAGLSMHQITEVLETNRVLAVPDAGTALAQAINKGEPLALTQPGSPFSRALAALADEVRARRARLPDVATSSP